MNIEQGNEILALFLGYKYKYNTSEDFSDIGGLYSNCRIYSKVPLRINNGSVHSDDWQKFRNEFIVIIESDWPCDYPNALEFHSNWAELMKVVEHLESLDLKEFMYQWPDEDGSINYNFESITVIIEAKTCYIDVNLSLDPGIILNPKSIEKEWDSKINAVWNSCVEAAIWYMDYMERNRIKT